jgi:hypothetical protein
VAAQLLLLLSRMDPGWWWVLLQRRLLPGFSSSPHERLRQAAAVAAQAGSGCNFHYLPTDPSKRVIVCAHLPDDDAASIRDQAAGS